MISLEQIRTLDEKVKKAVTALGDLRSENRTLKQKLADYQKRIEELEKLIADFKKDQGEIEQGIINAISQLETLETGPAESDVAGSEPASGEDTDHKPEPDPGEFSAGIEETGGEDAGSESAGDGEDTPETISEDTNEKELDIF